MKYEMKLNNEPFKAIKNGTKTLELRLNDEKRKQLIVGDYIELTEFEKYRIKQDKLYKSDFDLLIEETNK